MWYNEARKRKAKRLFLVSLSATSNSLLDCWSYAGVGRLKRFGEPFQPFYIGVLSHSHFLLPFLKNKSANLFAFLQNVV